MSGVTLISGDGNIKEKLGVGRHIFRPRTATDINKHAIKHKPATFSEQQQHQQLQQQRSNSVDHGSSTRNIDDIASTIFLTDSSTISLPIPSQNAYTTTAGASKYKTMPSPTRANTILPGANCLNEIFEEGTDVGSSDSATTTPRPVARHTHYVSNRTHSQGSVSSTSSTTTTTSAQRRSKFHKTRTASCSSSDASDDDSENRKKRAHKIVDSTKPLQPQRRDSHDDSSDSQDPGNATSSSAGTNAAGTCSIQQQSIVGPPHDDTTTKNGDNRQSSESNGRQKSGQQMGFRRHRAGRRRAGETRLRESQSLNRITEVQESEMPLSSMGHANGGASGGTSSSSLVTTTTVTTTMPATTNKPKGFSARLFHGFRKNDTQCVVDSSRIPLQNVNANSDEVEMVLGVELAKALKVTETKSSSATKKLKMLGRYFQVNCFFFFSILFV